MESSGSGSRKPRLTVLGISCVHHAINVATNSDRRRSEKLVPTLADRECHMVSATSPSDRNFDFLDLEPLRFLSSSSSNCS
jgi:hypothetical protein